MHRRTNHHFGIRPSIPSRSVQRGRVRLPVANDMTFAGRGVVQSGVASLNETSTFESRAVSVARAKLLVRDPAFPSRETLEKVAQSLAKWLNDHAH